MWLKNIYFFSLGCGLSIQAFGGMSLTELFALIFIPLSFFYDSIRKGNSVIYVPKKFSLLLVVFLLYIFAQIVSDIAANELLRQIIYDVLKLLSLLLLAIFLAKHSEYPSFLPFVFIGYGVCNTILLSVVYEDFLSAYKFWRLGIGEGVSFAIVALSALLFPVRLTHLLIFVLVVINVFFDFRGLALVMLIVFCYSYMSHSSSKLNINKILMLAIIPFVVYSFIAIYQYTDETSGNRRDMSNTLRAAITMTVFNDFIEAKMIGNGHSAFAKNHIVPYVGSEAFEKEKEGSTLIHGYFLVASYEAGKLGALFYLLLAYFVLVLLYKCWKHRFLRSQPELILMVFLCFYFLYGGLFLALSGFDRLVIACAIASFFWFESKNNKINKNRKKDYL